MYFDPVIVDQHTSYLVDSALPDTDIPLIVTLTGSRAYGFASEFSDYDYIGVHLMDTYTLLQHPSFRGEGEIHTILLDENLERIVDGSKSYVSLTSYELWKFISVYLKGSAQAYEVLFQTASHEDPWWNSVQPIFIEGLTNKIASSAMGLFNHDFSRYPTSRKKARYAIYRLAQAEHFLLENNFIWEGDCLLNRPTIEWLSGQNPLDQDEQKEIKNIGEVLIGKVKNLIIRSQLPDEVPQHVIERILNESRSYRARLI